MVLPTYWCATGRNATKLFGKSSAGTASRAGSAKRNLQMCMPRLAGVADLLLSPGSVRDACPLPLTLTPPATRYVGLDVTGSGARRRRWSTSGWWSLVGVEGLVLVG